MMRPIVTELAAAVDSEAPREERARVAATIIRNARGYRWVGIYDVGDEQIAVIGYSGSAAPAHPASSVAQGLSGEVVRARSTQTAGSETIVPILGAESGIVIGALDVESERPGAFAPDDVEFLEDCAAVLRPLYD
jgi:putative methionine-R-sulfoxide reductase with GAF domain